MLHHYILSGHNTGFTTRKNPMTSLSDWSKAVKARDKKCMCCGKESDLHAHHIKHKSTHPELILDIDNGKALCYSCHKLEHENNRPVRIRSNRPRRKTLNSRIEELEEMYRDIEALNLKLSKLVGQCKRGCCKSGLELSRIKHQSAGHA